MTNVPEIFGSLVFNDDIMRAKLPKEIYKSLKETRERGTPLDETCAQSIANAMKNWAVENGATHYTHWFQPMTGATAEKHDSFIVPAGDNKVIMEFSGKELIKGEPDASSFPSGGLRATFEARGYTSWDPTSNAFIKDGTLCIPTAFCSYGGEALDKKTPLLRSMEALDKQALRILRLFGDTTTTSVRTTAGAEQEYFLIDRAVADQRKDLLYCGRTLFGARPPKGQELEDHYFGVIKPRVSAYMKDLDEELWKLGILSKTKHNEVAPAQHELAPIFTTTNIATDHNQLTMEVMKKVASRHGLTCLLHEKPFAGVNGSGKHNNWSLATNTGENLLEPGKYPAENMRFLLFLTAVIVAVDEHQDLLRLSVASASNDHRLGAQEAPPAIVSIYLGDELTGILQSIEDDSAYEELDPMFMDTGVESLPNFAKDTTDRNRTSPFAFTGNKFEFRMPGSSVSLSAPNFMLNTAVCDVLESFADELEQAQDFDHALRKLIKRNFQEHKRIVFNGNNYSEEWIQEAKRRGLLNLRSTADAIPCYISEKNIKLFEKHGVLSRAELVSRHEISLENYTKQLNVEAFTMIDMINKDILPAVYRFMHDLSETILNKKQISDTIVCEPEKSVLEKLSVLSSALYDNAHKLYSDLKERDYRYAVPNREENDWEAEGRYYRDIVFEQMEKTRAIADEIESMVGEDYWPYPTYGKLLFSVR
ncbi:MAG: glutamine synthetase III [Oscillospiraceae bacterium]|nr:glutamine synthetase III [Oscillospiraceae bacterium]